MPSRLSRESATVKASLWMSGPRLPRRSQQSAPSRAPGPNERSSSCPRSIAVAARKTANRGPRGRRRARKDRENAFFRKAARLCTCVRASQPRTLRRRRNPPAKLKLVSRGSLHSPSADRPVLASKHLSMATSPFGAAHGKLPQAQGMNQLEQGCCCANRSANIRGIQSNSKHESGLGQP